MMMMMMMMMMMLLMKEEEEKEEEEEDCFVCVCSGSVCMCVYASTYIYLARIKVSLNICLRKSGNLKGKILSVNEI